jgi:hypothetical protein
MADRPTVSRRYVCNNEVSNMSHTGGAHLELRPLLQVGLIGKGHGQAHGSATAKPMFASRAEQLM